MRDLWPLGLVLLIGLLLVPPVGSFPLNDEWLFEAMVRSVLLGHGYEHHPYVQPTAVALVGWGAAFGAVFGPSLPVLRLAMAPLALLAAWATVQCARACGAGRTPALLCGVVLLVNPIFFSLASTFMTDVPSCALSVLSAWFYLRALRRGGTRAILFGTITAAIGFFVRQVTILPALAFALVALGMAVARPRAKRNWPWRPLAAFVVPWMGVALGYWWWRTAGGGGGDWAFPRTTPLIVRLMRFPGYSVAVVSTLGLLLAPLALARLAAVALGRERWTRRAWMAFGALTLVLGSTFVFLYRAPLPRIGNILDFYSMGPRAIFGQPVLGEADVQAMILAWRIATGIGVIAAAVLGVSALQAFAHARPEGARALPFDRGQAWFLGLWAAGAFATSYSPMTVQPFDRYLIPLLVVGSIVQTRPIGRRLPGTTKPICVLALFSLFAYSICLQHEYLGWNTARWQATDKLMARGIPAAQIDGGYEFNGVLKSADYVRLHGPRPFWMCLENQVWWPLQDRYRIAFSPLAGHRVLDRQGYFSWFTRRERYIYVLAMPGNLP